MFLHLLSFSILINIAISASDSAIEHLERDYPDIKEIFAQARLHTKPELAQCETFECIEKLLYREEDEALEKIANQCDGKCSVYSDAAAVESEFRRPKKPVGIHDEACPGKHLVDLTTKYLRQSGIDPRTVSIGCDKEYFKLNPKYLGYATTRPSLPCYEISFNVDKPILRDLQHIVAAHEVTHIVESHKAKSMSARMKYCTYMQYAFADELFKSDFVAFQRVHEKQAYLFPLTRYDDRLIAVELLDKKLLQCVKQFEDGTLNQQWHKSPPNETHPGCSELLPYILQIEKIRANNQKKARI